MVKKPVYAFIDSQNLNLGIRSQGWKLDFAKFRRTLVFKPTVTHKVKGLHETKGNVDAELVLHSMIQFPYYSKAVIVSGDGDFHCLIEYLESKNKLAKIIVPNHKYSSLLRKFAKYITQIQLFRSKIELKPPKKTKKRTFARDKTLR